MRPTQFVLRTLSSGILLLAAFSPALAEGVNASPTSDWDPNWIAHVAMTVLGSFVAAHLALEAFARPVQIANAPTFPKYMTSPQQYRLGSWIFVMFACVFFLLLVYAHREVVVAARIFEKELPEVVKGAFTAVTDETAPYFLVVITMGGCICTC
jgi:hypothetical protein